MIEVKISSFGKRYFKYREVAWDFEIFGLTSRDYSTKSNTIRGIHRTMRRLGIKRYQITDENGHTVKPQRRGKA